MFLSWKAHTMTRGFSWRSGKPGSKVSFNVTGLNPPPSSPLPDVMIKPRFKVAVLIPDDDSNLSTLDFKKIYKAPSFRGNNNMQEPKTLDYKVYRDTLIKVLITCQHRLSLYCTWLLLLLFKNQIGPPWIYGLSLFITLNARYFSKVRKLIG